MLAFTVCTVCVCVACMCIMKVCLFLCVCVCVFACEVSLLVGRHLGGQGGNNTRIHIRTTLTHRWGEGKTGSGGESYRLQKIRGEEKRWGRVTQGITEGRQGVTRERGGGWGAASGRVCFSWFGFRKVTKKYVEHLESGTARRGERRAAGGEVLKTTNTPVGGRK